MPWVHFPVAPHLCAPRLCISSDWHWMADERHAGHFLGQPTVGRQVIAPWYLAFRRAIYHGPKAPSFSPTLSIFGYCVPFPLSSFLNMPLAACTREQSLNYGTSKDGRCLSLGLKTFWVSFPCLQFCGELDLWPRSTREEMRSCCLLSVVHAAF